MRHQYFDALIIFVLLKSMNKKVERKKNLNAKIGFLNSLDIIQRVCLLKKKKKY